jgi:hypothetical protein
MNAIAASTPLMCHDLESPDAHILWRWNGSSPDPLGAVMFLGIRNKESNPSSIYLCIHFGDVDVIRAVREHGKPATFPGGLVESKHPPPMMDSYRNQ